MFYVLNKKKIKVLNFWVPERARVIHHDKKQLYVLNFEYAKPGTLRDTGYTFKLCGAALNDVLVVLLQEK